MAVFRFTSGHLRKPDHFGFQLFSHAQNRFEPLIMLSFPPIRAQKSANPKKPVFIVFKEKKRKYFREIGENSHFGKGVSIRYRVLGIFRKVGVYKVKR